MTYPLLGAMLNNYGYSFDEKGNTHEIPGYQGRPSIKKSSRKRPSIRKFSRKRPSPETEDGFIEDSWSKKLSAKAQSNKRPKQFSN